MDFMNINVDELEFDCTLERFQDEIVHPETGETLREDFGQSGPKIVCQHPELFLHYFSQGGSYESALGRPGGPPESTSFVLFVGDLRFAFDVTDKKQYVEGDSGTRLWEISNIADCSSVICRSPFNRLLPVEEHTRAIAESRKFDSREQQDQIVSIIVKALSSFNHSEISQAIKIKDGKPLSVKERKESARLFLKNTPEYRKIYTSKSWMQWLGSSKVTFTSYVTSSLEKGSYIA